MALIAAAGDFEIAVLRPSPSRPLAIAPDNERHFSQAIWRRLMGTNPHTAVWRALTFALPRLQPDLIHAEEEPDSIGGLQIAMARRLFAPRARLILHTWQNVNREKRWHVWRVIRTVLSQADGVLCASNEAIDLLRLFGFRGLTAEVPQYGVDLNTFTRANRHPPSDVFSILYAGRLIPEKGLDTLIDAVGRLNVPWQLTMLGDGPSRASLEAHSRTLRVSDRVHFVRRVPLSDVAQMMVGADVLVLPSRTTPVWKEQYGRVLVEAMACALPIVGSSSGAIPDVVDDAGLVFTEGNAAELADRLQRLAASPGLRHELGERGRVRVAERYSLEKIAAKTADFYRTVMTAKGRT